MGGKLGNFKMSGHFQWLSLVVGGELQVATLPRMSHKRACVVVILSRVFNKELHLLLIIFQINNSSTMQHSLFC